MQFKSPDMQLQFGSLHLKTQEAVDQLDKWLRARAMPPLIITEVLRTVEEQEEIYWQSIHQKLNCTEAQARTAARKKPSWHLYMCAIDARLGPVYTPSQANEIMTFLKNGRSTPEWEILKHTVVGKHDHLHIAYRDFGWRRRWEQQLQA